MLKKLRVKQKVSFKNTTVYKKVKEYIKEKGYYQSDIAELMGLHKARMSQYLSGKIGFPERKLVELCKILRLNYEEFKKDNLVEIAKQKSKTRR